MTVGGAEITVRVVVGLLATSIGVHQRAVPAPAVELPPCRSSRGQRLVPSNRGVFENVPNLWGCCLTELRESCATGCSAASGLYPGVSYSCPAALPCAASSTSSGGSRTSAVFAQRLLRAAVTWVLLSDPQLLLRFV